MDLTNPNNWHLVASIEKQVIYTIPGRRYVALRPSVFSIVSPVVTVDISSTTAPPRWFLGCWAAFYISSGGKMQRLEGNHKCRLGESNLLVFPFFEGIPYSLKLDFPYWIEDVKIEIHEYVGARQPVDIPLETLDSLARIEGKLDAL